MKKTTTLLSILSLSILVIGCSNRKCVGPNAHDGLYNALTCNYDSNIQILQVKLDKKTLERNNLFHNYQRLIAQITNKQNQINQLDEEIDLMDNEIKSILKIINTFKNRQMPVNSINILKLKSKLKNLNMKILNKSTFFDIDDALYTNKKLLVNNDKIQYAEVYNKNLLKDEKYAQAYDKNLLNNQKYAEVYNKNLLKDEKYAQAYNKNPTQTFAKAYQEDIQRDQKIRTNLSSQLENLEKSLTKTELSTNPKSIMTLMEEIKQYTNSLKKS